MLLFTQIGMASNPVEHGVLVEPNLAPAIVEASATSSDQVAVTVLPKPVEKSSASVKIVAKPSTAGSNLTVEQKVEDYFSKTPVLANIARCESGFRQYDSAGNILRGKVNKKDVGVMQINEQYHASRARALGLDLYTVDGNMAYAALLYKEQGTTPWLSSSACWGSKVASAT